MTPQLIPLGSYKEPLKKVPNGFGFYGVVMGTEDGTGVQCHICGIIKPSVSAHAYHAHQITSKEYKSEYGIATNTSMISEELRQRLVQSGLKNKAERLKRLTAALRKSGKKRGVRPGHTWDLSLESKNKRGSCPDQIKEKIIDVKNTLGHVPAFREFQALQPRYASLVLRMYGTWIKALKFYKITPKTRTMAKTFHRYTDEELLKHVQNFKQTHGKEPSTTDFHRHSLPSYATYYNHFGGIANILKLARKLNK